MDTLRDLGTVYLDGGDAARALELAETALSLVNEIDDRLFEAEVLNLLGAARSALGQHAQALAAYEAALLVAPNGSSRVGDIGARIGIAEMHDHFGRSQSALAYGQSALTLTRELGYRMLEADALMALAKITGDRGYAEQALTIHRETGYVAGMQRAVAVVANVLHAT